VTCPRVLVVDDHRGVREALVCLLDLVGFEVVGEAGDGADAVALARQVDPDLTLMDLSMPVVGGLDATRMLREALPRTPVVVLTAFESADLERAARAAGASAYLVKDGSVERLRAVLHDALAAVTGPERTC
jgi:DNA-binding NarL/FixJ family response regulator